MLTVIRSSGGKFKVSLCCVQSCLPLDLVSHLDGAQEALVPRLGSRREKGEVGPLQSQVLGHVLVHHGVGLAAVEHVLEVMPVQGCSKKVCPRLRDSHVQGDHSGCGQTSH